MRGHRNFRSAAFPGRWAESSITSGVGYKGLNVSGIAELRDGIKTIPTGRHSASLRQGESSCGCDIIREMFQAASSAAPCDKGVTSTGSPALSLAARQIGHGALLKSSSRHHELERRRHRQRRQHLAARRWWRGRRDPSRGRA